MPASSTHAHPPNIRAASARLSVTLRSRSSEQKGQPVRAAGRQHCRAWAGRWKGFGWRDQQFKTAASRHAACCPNNPSRPKSTACSATSNGRSHSVSKEAHNYSSISNKSMVVACHLHYQISNSSSKSSKVAARHLHYQISNGSSIRRGGLPCTVMSSMSKTASARRAATPCRPLR